MVYPVGVETVPVRWGHGFTALGSPVQAEISVRPIIPGTNKLVWLATGDPLMPMRDSRRVTDEDGYYITLPVVDQEGWVDAAGQAIMDWSYEATISWRGGSGVQQETKTFKVLSGQTAVDLDLIFTGQVGQPTVGELAVVTTLAGLTGNVTQEQLEGLGLGGTTVAPHPSFPGVLVIGE